MMGSVQKKNPVVTRNSWDGNGWWDRVRRLGRLECFCDGYLPSFFDMCRAVRDIMRFRCVSVLRNVGVTSFTCIFSR